MDYIKTISANVLPYNSRIFEYDWGANEDMIIILFTKSKEVNGIYKALHVNDSTKVPKSLCFQMRKYI